MNSTIIVGVTGAPVATRAVDWAIERAAASGQRLELWAVVGGAILTETVFSYPGLGLQLYNAVVNLDYPLMQALFLFIAAAVLLANFIVDLLYAFLDPRVRDGKAE